MKIALLIPTYNEAENIKVLLPQIAKSVANRNDINLCVHVIDDNSPDGTLELAKSLAAQLKSEQFSIETISRRTKEGLGKAYVHGFRNVLGATDLDYVLQMDADLSHNPAYLVDFFDEALKGTDFIVASRYVAGGGVPDWSWHRKLLSRFGNLYAKTLLGARITDYTGGFNMYSARLLRQIDFDRLSAPGYGFLITLKFEALRKASSIAQIPIIFLDRRAGESKMPLSTLANNFKLVFDLWRNK